VGISGGPSQGEALATWVIWAAVTLSVLATYSWVDPAQTYHVSREGIVGGLSRAVTLVNFPIGLVAIALTLVAVAALPRAAWWAATPALLLCATIPSFNEQSNLDAHWGNAFPAFGVAIALALTFAAARRAGSGFAPRRPWDTARVALALLVLLVSLPWLTANLGFHFPGDFFMGEELGREQDGTSIAAVHLGHHHGLDGSLLLLTALLLSRIEISGTTMRRVTFAYLGAMVAYGAVNCVQDAWNEQLVKRGWTDHSIPSAILPAAKPIWLVVIVLAVISTLALLHEDKGAAYSRA
jgi:hypothetical protein